MAHHDEIALRMKEYYEKISQTKLVRRTPVIVRIDGKAFHTFTKGFAVPFDDVLIEAMQGTAKYLCENVQGCVLAYTQSDEISLVLVDYKKLTSSAWFDYEVQKVCSIAASMATMRFNQLLAEIVAQRDDLDSRAAEVYRRAISKGAMFDARAFNIPKEEVANYIYWRQVDAVRNSVQMVGHANFSHKQLNHKSTSMIQDMLHEKGINWNDYPVYQKRGSCVIKIETVVSDEVVRSKWVVDKDIPIFKGDDREYIEKLVDL